MTTNLMGFLTEAMQEEVPLTTVTQIGDYVFVLTRPCSVMGKGPGNLLVLLDEELALEMQEDERAYDIISMITHVLCFTQATILTW